MREQSVFLFVDGEDDFSAMSFEQNYNPDEVYEEMLAEGVKTKTIEHEEDDYMDSIRIEIKEFGPVDEAFIDVLTGDFMDYDALKAKNFYRVR